MMQIERIEEPDLYFDENRVAKDAKTGLLAFGPYRGANQDAPKRYIRLGAIGTPSGYGLLRSFLHALRNPIHPDQDAVGDPTPFPGAWAKGPLGFQFDCNNEDFLAFPPDLIQRLEGLARNNRIELLAGETVRLLRRFYDEVHPRPDIVVLALDRKLIELCKDPRRAQDHIIHTHRTFKEAGKGRPPLFNFHHFIKAQAALLGIPTQILKPQTMLFERGTEDPHVVAWNLAVGMYYKATGIPWKLADIDDETCYIGFRHYEEFNDEGSHLNTSVAQVYMRTGESQVVRGQPFEWEPSGHDRTVYLDSDHMEALIRDASRTYEDARGRRPKRVVVHKPGPFDQNELDGIAAAVPSAEVIDALEVHNFPSFRAYVKGHNYPVCRGTMIDWGSEVTLFASGYVSSVDTYPGPGVPRPIQVVPARLESDLRDACKDILGLTKLDWNTASFSIHAPVTTVVPAKVGGVLGELPPGSPTPPSKYLYYM